LTQVQIAKCLGFITEWQKISRSGILYLCYMNDTDKHYMTVTYDRLLTVGKRNG